MSLLQPLKITIAAYIYQIFRGEQKICRVWPSSYHLHFSCLDISPHNLTWGCHRTNSAGLKTEVTSLHRFLTLLQCGEGSASGFHVVSLPYQIPSTYSPDVLHSFIISTLLLRYSVVSWWSYVPIGIVVEITNRQTLKQSPTYLYLQSFEEEQQGMLSMMFS